MGRRKDVSGEVHKQAFELYFETRAYRRVAMSMGFDQTTIARWASAAYECPFQCGYHDWQKLLVERDMQIHARIKLFDDEPKSVDISQELVLSNEHTKAVAVAEQRRQVAERIVKSDYERIVQWEIIWAKVLFGVTGQVLDFDALVDPNGDPLSEAARKQFLTRGLKLSSLEGGVRTLAYVQCQIDKLKERMNLQRRLAEDDFGTPKPAVGEAAPTLTIEEMRKAYQLLKDSPAELQSVLLKLIKSENRPPVTFDYEPGSEAIYEGVGTADTVSLSSS